MSAVLGLIAFASPVDAGSSGAAPHTALSGARSPASPTRHRIIVAVEPSAEEDMAAMADASVARQRVVDAQERAARNARRAVTGEAVWRALAQCESNGNPRAVSASGTYRGAFQFSTATWLSSATTATRSSTPTRCSCRPRSACRRGRAGRSGRRARAGSDSSDGPVSG